MWFNEGNSDATDTREWEQRMVMQKETFPVNDAFRAYLKHYGRELALPVLYPDLANYSHANSVRDKKGKWTHWENAVYEPPQFTTLKAALIKTYSLLKKKSSAPGIEEPDVERIDFCDYGNSVPFRIKITGSNDNHDFFYVKQSDASRIYGLELEHLMTDNPINFLHFQNTLVEEHIEGISGDTFLQQNLNLTTPENAAIARAFVQFNESCFVRLLGDMRSYNFVVSSPVSGNCHLRAIDFDQQCYEGRKILYFPRYYKENAEYVDLVLQHLTAIEIEESRQNEFNAMAARIIRHPRQLMELLNSMVNDDISENYKINILKKELNDHFNTTRFTNCKTMGAIVKQQLKQVLQKHLQMAQLK